MNDDEFYKAAGVEGSKPEPADKDSKKGPEDDY